MRLPHLHAGRLDDALKRLTDVAGAALGLAILWPLMAAVVLIIKATSRGPAIFTQERIGLGGTAFRVLKFRTMTAGAAALRPSVRHLNELSGPVFKISRDPRTTRVGRVLRKTSLDELPQLWNVLRGEMSLVGPRPLLPEEVAEIAPEVALVRHSVRPGLTGLWQVSGRSEIRDFDEWMRLDIEYVGRRSAAYDFWIMLRTPLAVIGGRGAS